jgi:hypothetical protein
VGVLSFPDASQAPAATTSSRAPLSTDPRKRKGEVAGSLAAAAVAGDEDAIPSSQPEEQSTAAKKPKTSPASAPAPAQGLRVPRHIESLAGAHATGVLCVDMNVGDDVRLFAAGINSVLLVRYTSGILLCF